MEHSTGRVQSRAERSFRYLFFEKYSRLWGSKISPILLMFCLYTDFYLHLIFSISESRRRDDCDQRVCVHCRRCWWTEVNLIISIFYLFFAYFKGLTDHSGNTSLSRIEEWFNWTRIAERLATPASSCTTISAHPNHRLVGFHFCDNQPNMLVAYWSRTYKSPWNKWYLICFDQY